MLNVAHRGASGVAPEHTFPAYDLALALGADYLEQDVHMTRDGVLVVLHDATLDRTTSCSAFVADLTLGELQALDAGSWFNGAYPARARPEYAGLRIPTLEEVFRRYGTGARYYVETKDPELYPGMEEELLRLVYACGLHGRALIQSFSVQSLQKTHALDPAIPLIRLHPEVGAPAIAETLPETACYAAGIGPRHTDVDEALVKAAHDLQLAVHPHTVDAIHGMRALGELGVDGVFTNYPGRLARVLTTRRRRQAIGAPG